MPSRAPSPEQSSHSDPDPFGAIDFALFGPAGPASNFPCNKKNPCGATPITARCQVLDQAPGEAETALVALWSLMRFLSLRLKPKAAAS